MAIAAKRFDGDKSQKNIDLLSSSDLTSLALVVIDRGVPICRYSDRQLNGNPDHPRSRRRGRLVASKQALNRVCMPAPT
jgi:hypothetical protein